MMHKIESWEGLEGYKSENLITNWIFFRVEGPIGRKIESPVTFHNFLKFREQIYKTSESLGNKRVI